VEIGMTPRIRRIEIGDCPSYSGECSGHLSGNRHDAPHQEGRNRWLSLISLLKWGGKIVKGGKGSHTKIRMPSGRLVSVPQKPGIGTVKSILKQVLKL
jgi:predicted RNA binding protein YcfA (HicA-like mRNA interferase family)